MMNYKQAFIETLIWSSIDDEGNTIDHITTVTDTDNKIDTLINKFIRLVELDPILESLENITEQTGNNDGQIMYDLCLTINGHGAGFWDGDYSEDGIGEGIIGGKLTTICRGLESIDIYQGDDGEYYVY
jgi:hypothetical protein